MISMMLFAEMISKRGGGSYIVGQLTVVQIALEQDELALLQILEKVGRDVWQPPVAARRGPEPVRTQDQLALLVESAPLVEQELDLAEFAVGERLVGPARVVGRGVESLRVGQRAEEIREVLGDDVRDEPRNGLGTQDHGRGEIRRQKVPRKDEVDEELEAGVVQHDVHAPLAVLPGLARITQNVVGGVRVVDDDVLLRGLARLRALQLLDVLVGEIGEERQVSGVAPKADLAHLREQYPLGLLDLLRSLPLGTLLRFQGERLVSSR